MISVRHSACALICPVLLVLWSFHAAVPLAAQARKPVRTVASLTETDDALRFLVIGDWGRHGQDGQSDVAKQLGLAARRLDPEFIISTGDNFYPQGVASVTDPAWRASFEDVYTDHALGVEWYVVLGNHDYQGNAQAEIDYSQVSRRWRMPARYFAKEWMADDSTRVLFAFIDTSPYIADYRTEPEKYKTDTQDTVAQTRWLDSTLAASTAPWKFVVGHHQIYSGGKRSTQLELERNIVPLMQKHGVQAYFNGHEHDLQHIVRPGSPVHYFVSGAGSERRPTGRTEGTRYAESVSGFMSAVVTKDAMEVRAFDHLGRERYRTRVPVKP